MKTPETIFKNVVGEYSPYITPLTEELCIIAMKLYAKQFQPAKDLMPETIMKIVCDSYGVTIEKVKSRTRVREVVWARQLTAVLFKFGLKMTTTKAGYELGGFDHATILHSIYQVKNRYNSYKLDRTQIDSVILQAFESDEQRAYITDRIIDPHKDRRNVLSKFTPVASN